MQTNLSANDVGFQTVAHGQNHGEQQRQTGGAAGVGQQQFCQRPGDQRNSRADGKDQGDKDLGRQGKLFLFSFMGKSVLRF